VLQLSPVGKVLQRIAVPVQCPTMVCFGGDDYVICSANFYPPGCDSADAVINRLHGWGVPHVAITQGCKPIWVSSQGQRSLISVPSVAVVDTLGAGDVIHGAFCHFILRQGFEAAIAAAAIVATQSCQRFGTRQWMQPPCKCRAFPYNGQGKAVETIDA